MTQRLQFKRGLMLLGLLALAFTGLGDRLVDLQVLRHDELAAKAQSNTQREFRQVPRRGNILDSQGNLLATSIFVKTVCADPVLIGNQTGSRGPGAGPLLQTNEGELCQRLLPRLNEKSEGRNGHQPLRRAPAQGADETWQKIQQTMANLSFGVDEKKLTRPDRAFFRELRNKAIFTDPEDDQLRIYPGGSLARMCSDSPEAANGTNMSPKGRERRHGIGHQLGDSGGRPDSG